MDCTGAGGSGENAIESNMGLTEKIIIAAAIGFVTGVIYAMIVAIRLIDKMR